MKKLFEDIKNKKAIVNIITNNGVGGNPFIYNTLKNTILGIEDEYVVLKGTKGTIFIPYNSITVISQS